MARVPVPNAGAIGVIKDVAAHELPLGAWTDAKNMRFRKRSAIQFYGHGPSHGEPAIVPYHLVQLNIGADSYWLYAGAEKIYAATVIDGEAVHTNLTRQEFDKDVNYTGKPNQWTSTLLSGIPILNPGNEVDPPQQWNLDPKRRMKVLDNWPAKTWCKAMRAYRNFLIALNVTKSEANFPFMVKWSSTADPGGVPITWDPADATQEAGEYDLAEGSDRIIDGLQLRDSFMIYKEQSVWRMDYIGGPFVFSFRKVLGLSGAMNRNCIVELDGVHAVLTGSDFVVHDGQSATPVLDDVAREALFQDMDTDYNDRAFVFKNPFLNEVFVCYASIGASAPNKALVWNYKDKTVTYRDIPNLHHAAFGKVSDSLGDSWAADNDPWDSDLTAWNQPDNVPNLARVLMASADKELLLLDAAATFNGTPIESYLERRGLAFDADDVTKRIVSIRPRITGTPGGTVIVKIGGHMTDPAADPEWDAEVEFVIGEDVAVDCMVDYRYLAVRFEAGTATTWRLDSYDLDVQRGSKW